MLREAGQLKARRQLGHVELLQMNAERLTFPDASFDTVLDSFSLCVYSDPAKVRARATAGVRVTQPQP